VQTFAETSQSLRASPSDAFVASAKTVLQANLLEPLKNKEDKRSRFSRAVLPPQARRIRILDNTLRTDGRGQPFVSFSIDESRGFSGSGDKDLADAHWLQDAITGCVYPQTGKILVRRGTVYYSSSILLGQQTPIAPPDVCTAR
jgi:hypothetical protein